MCNEGIRPSATPLTTGERMGIGGCRWGKDALCQRDCHGMASPSDYLLQ